MMSNALAIAATTTALRQLLFTRLNADIPGTHVTTKPLDKARDGNGNQINLFLYHTTLNTAYSNMNLPGQVKPGETAAPPLALNLHYLITVYGDNEDEADPTSHRLLGQVMSTLHDHPLLGREEIKNALEESGLHEQLERIRITPQPLSLEELSKLWNTFQTGYRLSVAYQVTVVLIDSTRTAKAPLPVLKRGSGEEDGVTAQPALPPLPTLTRIQTPHQPMSVHLGEQLVLKGHHLMGDTVKVRLAGKYLDPPVELPVLEGGTAHEVHFLIPNVPEQAVAGMYTAAVVIEQPGESAKTSNALPFAVAPRIEAMTPNPAPRTVNNQVHLTLRCSPQVHPRQWVALLLGDREIWAEPHPTPTDTLMFIVQEAVPGEYFVRLRVDGVDSVLMMKNPNPPPDFMFDAHQKVTVI